jgi:hypothetical protein
VPRTPPGALTDAERTVLAVVAAAARQGTRTPALFRMSVLWAAARGTPASAARAAGYALLADETLALADPDAPLTPHPRPRGLALLPRLSHRAGPRSVTRCGRSLPRLPSRGSPPVAGVPSPSPCRRARPAGPRRMAGVTGPGDAVPDTAIAAPDTPTVPAVRRHRRIRWGPVTTRDLSGTVTTTQRTS